MSAPVWNFAGYRYCPVEGLRREGSAVDLPPKARQLLELLLRSEGALVSKATIAAALWPRDAASDDSISRVVHVLRRALSEGGDEIVKTVYGVGVRLDVAAAVYRAPGAAADRGGVSQDLSQDLRHAVYEIAAGRTAANLRSALAALRVVVVRAPENAEAWSLQADLTVWLAVRGVLAPSSAAEQISHYTSSALKLSPDNVAALASSGWALAVLAKRRAEARRRLDRAVELAPEDPLARYYRAWLRVDSHDLAGALDDVETGVAAHPLDGTLLSLRARLTLCVGRVDEADALARDAQQLRPDVDGLFYTRVVAASLRGDHPSAVRLAEKAAKITGGERISLAYLSYALARARRETEARRVFDAASVGFPTSALLAPTLVALRDLEGAHSLLREAEDCGSPWRSFAWCDPRLAGL